jgi:hypothetical protein
MRELRNVDKILIGELEGRRPCGRLKHRWKGNIKWILNQ